MKTTLLSAAFILVGTFAFAQEEIEAVAPAIIETATMEQSGKGCAMANAKVWESLDLSADQKAKVEAIQANCKETCANLPEGEKRTAAMEMYEKDIKAVLTPEQLKGYKSCCAGKAGHGEMKAEEKIAPKKEKK